MHLCACYTSSSRNWCASEISPLHWKQSYNAAQRLFFAFVHLHAGPFLTQWFRTYNLTIQVWRRNKNRLVKHSVWSTFEFIPFYRFIMVGFTGLNWIFQNIYTQIWHNRWFLGCYGWFLIFVQIPTCHFDRNFHIRVFQWASGEPPVSASSCCFTTMSSSTPSTGTVCSSTSLPF